MGADIGPVVDPSDYVRRALDDSLLVYLERGEYVTLRGGRQTGKTSAVIQVMPRLRSTGAGCVYLDLERLTPSADGWCSEFAHALAEQMDVIGAPGVESAVAETVSPGQLEAMLSVLFAAREEARAPLFIFLDEITAIPEPVQAHFFAAIRAFHGLRGAGSGHSAMSEAVTFAMVGTFDPERLVEESLNSPFNVSQELDTTDFDFDLAQCQAIAVRHGLKAADGEQAYRLTSGHPYLTRRILRLVHEGLSLDEARKSILCGKDANIRQLASNLATLGVRGLNLLVSIVDGESVTVLPAVNRVFDRLMVLGVIRVDQSALAHIRCPLYADFITLFVKAYSAIGPQVTEPESSSPVTIECLVFAALPEEFSAFKGHLSNAVYHVLECGRQILVGAIERADGTSLAVGLCFLAGMGNVSSSSAATQVVDDARPKSVFMCGIAAGTRREEQEFGDVLIGSDVCYFGLQKLKDGAAQYRPVSIPSDALLLDRAAPVAVQWARPGLGDLREGIGPKVHFGPLGCGESVYADEAATAVLLELQPKLVGLEMESYGVAHACSHHIDRPRFLPVRGISDFADSAKDDSSHEIAANAAACWLAEFLRSATLP